VQPKPLASIGEMYAALRACWVPPARDVARRGMEYTVRFAFKRDGDIVAPPFVTYASHDAPAQVRDIYRDAVNATLRAARRCISAMTWPKRWPVADRHPLRGQPDPR